MKLAYVWSDTEGEYNDSMTFLNKIEEFIPSEPDLPEITGRRNRSDIYEFAEQVNVLLRKKITRADPSYNLMEFIFESIAPFAEDYMINVAGLEEELGKRVSALLRAVRPETVVKHVGEPGTSAA